MNNLLLWITANFPLLRSPRFWGVVGSAFFVLARQKGWIDQDWSQFVGTVVAGATAIGTAKWLVKKPQ